MTFTHLDACISFVHFSDFFISLSCFSYLIFYFRRGNVWMEYFPRVEPELSTKVETKVLGLSIIPKDSNRVMRLVVFTLQ